MNRSQLLNKLLLLAVMLVAAGGQKAVAQNYSSPNATSTSSVAGNPYTVSGCSGLAAANYVFTYSYGDTNHIVLRGSLAGDALEVNLRRLGPTNFLLLNRGFHWINEYPLNR